MMPSDKIKNKLQSGSEPMFVTWSDPSTDEGRSMNLALTTSAKALKAVEGITRGARFRGGSADISIREESSRRDYETYRPGESTAKDSKNIIRQCMNAYRQNPLLHNIIDLMGDFTVQGIEIVHSKPGYDALCKEWARKVRLKHVSERFANMLYRSANVPVRVFTSKISSKDIEALQRSQASPDIDFDRQQKPPKNEIPTKYIVYNPQRIDILGDELALLAGHLQYGVRINPSVLSRIKQPNTPIDKSLIQKLPTDLIALVRAGIKSIPIEVGKMKMFHYKKDDDDLWAEPMTYSLMKDLIVLEKLKLADLAALDGAISHIRLWRLGSLEYKIMPTEAAIARLAEVLVNNVGGGAMDLIWGPELDFKETSTDIHRFLGREKYASTLESIYAGLGVPPTLTGSATAAGFTNNFISLKTLTERLNYGRTVLIEFWQEQFRLLQQALGMREPPTLRFSHMTLSDEAAERALLIQLLDRGIISDDTILERFGETPEYEQWKVKKEVAKRDKGTRPAKVGPYHQDHKTEMKKALLGQGVVAPSQVGVDLPEAKPGEKTPSEIKVEQQAQLNQQKNKQGRAGEGRPVNTKDSKKRKQKRVVPRGTSASLFAANTNKFTWAREAQKVISDIVDPLWLESCNKKNMRQLSVEEKQSVEDFKYAVLCSCQPYQEISVKYIEDLTAQPMTIPAPVDALCKETISQYVNKHGKEPIIEDLRAIQASVYVFWRGDFDG